MAKAETARTEPTPLSDRLPEEILIWEILVRLPPKNLARCRAVCRAWRHITSTHHFLLAHHRHQPSLPLLSGYEYGEDFPFYQDMIPFDHRAATAAAQLQPLARLIDPKLRVVASCDGLLVMSMDEHDETHFFVCNPVTRQWGDLPILRDFHFSGIYPHHPTGEYRLLLYRSQIQESKHEGIVPGDKDSWYVFTLGCGEVPRCIGWPEVASHGTPVLLRGSLHWYPAKHHSRSKMILAFDTKAESFRLMHAPVLPESAHGFETQLFQMDGMLGLYMHNDAVTVVDIWVMHDYESEVWTFKYRVELPVPEITRQFQRSSGWDVVMVASEDHDVLVLVHFEQWLLHINVEGKLVASCGHDSQGLRISSHQLKQSLVQHTFFPVLCNYQVDRLPFCR